MSQPQSITNFLCLSAAVSLSTLPKSFNKKTAYPPYYSYPHYSLSKLLTKRYNTQHTKCMLHTNRSDLSFTLIAKPT